MDRRRCSSDRGAFVVRVIVATVNGRTGKRRLSVANSCCSGGGRCRCCRTGFGGSGCSSGRIVSAPDNIIASNNRSSGRSETTKTAVRRRREISSVLRSAGIVA